MPRAHPRRGAGARSVDLASHGGHTRGSPLTRLHRSGLLRAPRSQDVKMYAYYVVHAAEACVSAAAEAEAAGAAAVAAATLTSNGWHSRVAYCTRGQQHPHGPTRDSGVQPQSRPSHNPHAQSTRPEEPDLPLPASPTPHVPQCMRPNPITVTPPNFCHLSTHDCIGTKPWVHRRALGRAAPA